jgi:hypothetical protein
MFLNASVLSSDNITSDESVSHVQPATARIPCAEAVASVVTRQQTDCTVNLPVHINEGDYAMVPPKLRVSRKKTVAHFCTTCLGRTCVMCNEGCIIHEPTLLICNGQSCGCTKVRKGATYFVAKDGTRQYCQKCCLSREMSMIPLEPP